MRFARFVLVARARRVGVDDFVAVVRRGVFKNDPLRTGGDIGKKQANAQTDKKHQGVNGIDYKHNISYYNHIN